MNEKKHHFIVQWIAVCRQVLLLLNEMYRVNYVCINMPKWQMLGRTGASFDTINVRRRQFVFNWWNASEIETKRHYASEDNQFSFKILIK